MDVTPNDARQAIAAAENAAQEVQRVVDHKTSRIVLVWAFVYFIAPLVMHFLPLWGVIPQQILLVCAIAYTIYDGFRNSLVSGENSKRVGWFWGITFAFGWMWFLVLDPGTFDDPAANLEQILKQMWAFGVGLAMFVYTAMGLWVGRIYVVTGVVVSAATLLGYLLLGPWFWLWSAFTGGGTLFIAGLLLKSRGRV